jgi:hypothetical protein
MVYKYHQLVYKENTIFAAAKDQTPDQQPTPAQSASANRATPPTQSFVYI